MKAVPALAAAVLLSLPSGLRAGDIASTVTDVKGRPVKDAVVYAQDLSGGKTPPPAQAAVMDQRGMEFVPHVLPVQTGTRVSFPNHDNIFHHVYSFSAAKTFELPLYKGKPASPVVFDKPGVVTLGCNIHDWMLGYIVVLETPYFAVTGVDGAASLRGLPPGDDEVRVWHADLADPVEKTAQRVSVKEGGKSDFVIKLKTRLRLRRAPGPLPGASY